MPLQVMPDGTSVMSAGFMVESPVKFAIESDGIPQSRSSMSRRSGAPPADST